MSPRVALIFGATGQDGAYLSHLLLTKGYRVHGVSRDVSRVDLSRLRRLGVAGRIELHSADLAAPRGGHDLVDALNPDEIYNLSGQSSVVRSLEQPLETFDSIAVASVNLLEALREQKRPARLFQAISSEVFGDDQGRLNERSAFRPRSPYAAAKAAAYWETAAYREAFGLHACCGILANHESPLRPAGFVTAKIVRTAIAIAQGSDQRLKLGDIGVGRDWGWAPEYVEAMWLSLQAPIADDYVIATGETNLLSDLVAAAFEARNLDWRDHVDIDESLFRPGEPRRVELDPAHAKEVLGWSAKCRMRGVVERLVAGALEGKLGPAPWVEGDLVDRGAA